MKLEVILLQKTEDSFEGFLLGLCTDIVSTVNPIELKSVGDVNTDLFNC